MNRREGRKWPAEVPRSRGFQPGAVSAPPGDSGRLGDRRCVFFYATLFNAVALFSVAAVFRFPQFGPMRAKTEELLYLLLWAAEIFSRPTWRNLSESFESWAYRKGLRQQLLRLEKQGWIERQVGLAGNRLLRLTEVGRLKALGGRDPET